MFKEAVKRKMDQFGPGKALPWTMAQGWFWTMFSFKGLKPT
jgi:hypothetical protein